MIYKVEFPSIVVFGKDEKDAKDYVRDQLIEADFYDDLYEFEIEEITSCDQISNGWVKSSIPWNSIDNNTIEDHIKLKELLSKLDKAEQKLILNLINN